MCASRRSMAYLTALAVSLTHTCRLHSNPLCPSGPTTGPDFGEVGSSASVADPGGGKGVACAGTDDGTALVFNCQMGRGRTTTGMVCACIMMRASSGKLAAPAVHREGTDPRIVGDFRCVRELVYIYATRAPARGPRCCCAQLPSMWHAATPLGWLIKIALVVTISTATTGASEMTVASE